MGKNTKKPATKTNVPSLKKSEEKKALTGTEIVSALQKACAELGVTSFMLTAIGSDGAVVPAVSADSIGNLLTMKYVSDKEITRQIEAVTVAPAQAAEGTPAQ